MPSLSLEKTMPVGEDMSSDSKLCSWLQLRIKMSTTVIAPHSMSRKSDLFRYITLVTSFYCLTQNLQGSIFMIKLSNLLIFNHIRIHLKWPETQLLIFCPFFSHLIIYSTFMCSMAACTICV